MPPCRLHASLSVTARQLAEATYMKKKMYYNMRAKTLRQGLGVLSH